MKRSIKIPFLLSALLVVIGFSGCLKDTAYDKGQIQSVRTSGSEIKPIEIGLTATSNANYLSLSFNATPADTSIQLVPVTLATNAAASQDIHVTLVRNDSLLSKYNDANGTSLVDPTAIGVLDNAIVTIPKGSNTGFLKVHFKPTDLLGVPAAIGFTIGSVQEAGYVISGNLQNGIVAINIKNKYDGAYTATGHFVDAAAATITDAGVYPEKIYLITESGNSNAFYDVANSSYLHVINSGGSPSSYGGFAPQFTFDLNTNAVTAVTNYYGQNSGSRKRSGRLDITGVNALTGTPGTVGSVIKVSYVLVQAGADRTSFTETYTYTGPRP